MVGGRSVYILMGCVLGGLLGSVTAALATEPNPLGAALGVLGETPRGRELVARSLRFWKATTADQLLEHLRPSEVSRTDSVLVRRYDPARGNEIRERQVVVYVRQDQSQPATVLDLAHELVHATATPSWDPYDPKLTAGRYVRISIEGAGGEMEAVTSECEVGQENPKLIEEATPRCEAYWRTTKPGVDPERVREDFYRVGQWMDWVAKQLGPERAGFTRLSPKAPRLYSSTGRAPYPVSLIQEYREITAIACENSRKRIEQAGRAPASESRESRDLLRGRCQGFAPTQASPVRAKAP